MSTPTFAPRQARPGQLITFAGPGGTIRRLAAEEVEEGRWVIQPQDNADEAAVKRHRLEVDEELAAKQAEEAQPKGDDLRELARELDIPGRSRMNAEQLREAIAEAQAAAEAGDDNASAGAGDENQDGADAPSQED